MVVRRSIFRVSSSPCFFVCVRCVVEPAHERRQRDGGGAPREEHGGDRDSRKQTASRGGPRFEKAVSTAVVCNSLKMLGCSWFRQGCCSISELLHSVEEMMDSFRHARARPGAGPGRLYASLQVTSVQRMHVCSMMC